MAIVTGTWEAARRAPHCALQATWGKPRTAHRARKGFVVGSGFSPPYFPTLNSNAPATNNPPNMRLELRRMVVIVVIGFMAVGLSACSTSTGTINTPIGQIQLGMYLDDVHEFLGDGMVVEPLKTRGENTVETRAYPSDDGRTYIVYYVNDVVRRWELKAQAPAVSTGQPQ